MICPGCTKPIQSQDKTKILKGTIWHLKCFVKIWGRYYNIQEYSKYMKNYNG